MARIALRLYVDPGGAEVFLNLKLKDGDYRRLTAIIDTGAAVSLLPEQLTDIVDYRLIADHSVTIEQAGIAQQSFSATEAIIALFLKDSSGNRTREMDVKVWFAKTSVVLIGFADLLERATLYIDMRDMREGWIEVDE